MIDIIALIFLTRYIGNLALQKGQTPGRWKLRLVLMWISLEFLGILIGMSISKNLVLSALLGLGLAFGSFLLIKYQLERLPDTTNNQA
jgi:hypothetical protein